MRMGTVNNLMGIAQGVLSKIPQEADAPLSYQQMYERLTPRVTPTPEDLEKERQAYQRNMTLAKIGDGLSAFSDAYARARGVQQPASTPSMSRAVQDRYDKMLKERQGREKEWYNGWMNAARMDNLAKAEERRAFNADLAARKQDWLEKYQQGILDDKHEQRELDRLYKEGQITKWEHDAASNALRAQAAWVSANNKDLRGGSGMGEYQTVTTIERDKRGRETGRTTTRTRGSGQDSGGQSQQQQGNGSQQQHQQGNGVGGFSIHNQQQNKGKAKSNFTIHGQHQ